MLGQLPALESVVLGLAGEESPAAVASATEFVLEGLHLAKRLNKDAVGHPGHLPGPVERRDERMARFRYSKWDGTQVGFEFDADDIFGELTDELLYHGDLNQALQRLMQRGFTDRNGERVAGMREILERLRQRRREMLDQHDLGGPYEDIAQRLRDIVDQERGGIDNLVEEARQSGDQRRQEITDEVAAERRMALDLLPPDLAGQVQSLQEYEWTSSEAREAFDQLMEELRSQLMQSYFNQMSSAMSDVSPESLQRMKDMFNDLNQMLETRAAGGDTDRMFEEFMDRYGDMFPGNPQNLDELLEQMARQMAAMQQLLNSMSPEQRAQLQQLAESLLEDMDLRWQVDRLGANLRQAFPQAGWDRQYNFSGQDPLGFAEAASVMNQLGDMDQLEQMMSTASNPGALAEVDIDRASELLGDDAARSLEQLAKLARQLAEAGLIDQREGRLELTPRGLRKIGQNALSDLFSKLIKDRMGRHLADRSGIGHERTYETKGYEWGDPFNLSIERTVRNAIGRSRARHPGAAVGRRLRGGAHRVADVDGDGAGPGPVAVHADARQLPGRQEGGHGAAFADHDPVPAGLPRPGRFRRAGPGAAGRAAAGGLVGLHLRDQHAARPDAGPAHAGPPERHQAGDHDHRRGADRPHPARRPALLQLPAGAGDHPDDPRGGGPGDPGGHPHQHVHARRHRLPAGLRGEDDAAQPGPGVFHHARRRSGTTCWSTSSTRSGPGAGPRLKGAAAPLVSNL